MKWMRAGVFLGIACTNAAWAGCLSNERVFLACEFPNGKAVELCLSDDLVRYSFGRPDEPPELALSTRFGEGAEAIPWSGVGRSIWEAVRITNNDVIYEIYGGYDRFAAVEGYPEYKEHPQFGGINVLDRDENMLAQLGCIPSTVDYRLYP